MRSPRWCYECHTFHDMHVTKPVYIDIAENCISADDWRQMHYDEEKVEDVRQEAWWEHGVNLLDTPPPPLYKLVHGCGCTVLSTHKVTFDWCFDCQRRMTEERHEY